MNSNATYSLKKGIIVVFIANLINLSVSLIKNFVMPKYLPVETYADIKLYQLYISYAGFAALGYIDGMYLKYGGKKIEEISRIDFDSNLSTFRIFQLIVSLGLCAIGVIKGDNIISAMALSICALNMADYYKCFFQATGEFSSYSRIMNSSSIAVFAINMVLLFALHVTAPMPYIAANVITIYLVWLILEAVVRKKKVSSKVLVFDNKELLDSINSGWSLMLGTFISTFMTGLDRWCVYFTMDKNSFAQYAFAASVLGFLAYAISPISITLYNYFCRGLDEIDYGKIRQMILIFVTAVVSCAFPIKFILEHYLGQYYYANNVIFVLFASQIIYGFIRCYYVNMYKAYKRQKVYLRNIVIVAISGVVFNIVLYYLFHRMISFSFGTLLASVLWLILCARDFYENKNTRTELLYMALLIISFASLGFIVMSYIGLILYLTIWLLLSLLLMKDSFVVALNVALNTFRKVKGK